MEKRMFLAVGLSLVVVIGYQAFFAPKPLTKSENTQDVLVEHLTSIKDDVSLTKNTVKASTPLATQNFQLETFDTSTGDLGLVFENKFGSIDDIHLNNFNYHLPIKGLMILASLPDAPFVYERLDKKINVLTAQNASWQVEKIYRFIDETTASLSIKVTNLTDAAQAYDFSGNIFTIDNSIMDKNENGSDWTLFEYSLKSENKIIRKNSVANFNEKWNKTETKPVSRFAYRNRYFAVAVVPDRPATAYSTTMISDKELGIGLKFPAEIIAAGETRTLTFKMYVGPQKMDLLKKAGSEFDSILVYSDWGWLDAISKAILWVLETVHKYIPSGLAIILVSFLIYALMYPLTITSLTSMRKMQALQPKMAELKKKHAKSPEKMNQEVMELYKKNNVNPMSGCLPMLLQMPIFVGLYQVLWRSIFLRGEGFLWMKDLSLPDRLFKLPINIPFLGEYFNILPILMAGTMFIQQKLNMAGGAVVDPEQQMQQKMMLYMMPVFLGFIFYNFSSGLNLYFVVFYALSAVTQWKVGKDVKMAA